MQGANSFPYEAILPLPGERRGKWQSFVPGLHRDPILQFRHAILAQLRVACELLHQPTLLGDKLPALVHTGDSTDHLENIKENARAVTCKEKRLSHRNDILPGLSYDDTVNHCTNQERKNHVEYLAWFTHELLGSAAKSAKQLGLKDIQGKAVKGTSTVQKYTSKKQLQKLGWPDFTAASMRLTQGQAKFMPNDVCM